ILCTDWYWGKTNPVHSLDQSFHSNWLQQIIDCFEIESINCKFLMGRRKDHLGWIAKCTEEFMPHQLWHANIQEHKVNLFLLQYFHCLKSILAGTDDLQSGNIADMVHQHINSQWLVIYYQAMNFHKFNDGSIIVLVCSNGIRFLFSFNFNFTI